MAAKTHDAAAVNHKSICIGDQVDFTRHFFVERGSDVVEFREEPAPLGAGKRHSWRHKFVAARYQRPEQGCCERDAKKEQAKDLKVRRAFVQKQVGQVNARTSLEWNKKGKTLPPSGSLRRRKTP